MSEKKNSGNAVQKKAVVLENAASALAAPYKLKKFIEEERKA